MQRHNSPRSGQSSPASRGIRIAFVLAALSVSFVALAATITVTANSNYFAGHSFGSFNGANGAAPTGGNPGNGIGPAFTASVVNGANGYGTNRIATYTPGNLPAGTAYPTPPRMQEVGNNNQAADLIRHQFASALASGTHVYLQDVDNSETVTMRFFDCAGAQLNPSGFDSLVMPSNNPTFAFSATTVVATGSAATLDEPLAAVIVRSAQVCRIDYSIIAAATSLQVGYSLPPPTLTLRKQWSGAAVGDDATVTVSRGATVIDTLASDAGSAGELDTDTTPVALVFGETVTVAETLAAGNTGQYAGALACTGATDANPADGVTTTAADARASIVCTFTNTRQQGSITIIKDALPNDAQDFSFNTTGAGLANFQLDDDANATLSNTQTFTGLAPGSRSVTETLLAAWTLTALTCTGDTDNGSTINLPGGAVTIDLDAGENITCTFTNSRLPTLSLFKASNAGTGTFNFNLTNADTDVSVGSVGNQSAAAITTATAGTPVQFDASPILTGTQNIRIASFNAPVVITEAQTAGFNLQAATSCTAGTSGATFTQALVNNGTTAGSMTITPPVGGFVPGSTISCTFVNAPLQSNLQVTKTNNAAQVTSGTPTTYTIVVTNNGPDAVTGAQVSDTPSAGLVCPAANTVTCAPAGNCPASPLTVGNLLSGITLPTLANGATATLSFTCNVQ